MRPTVPLSFATTQAPPTLHAKEREERFRKYGALLDAPVVEAFWVDRHHVNGSEIHVVNAEAIACIYNYATRKLITVKALRPAQLDAYYCGDTVPASLRIASQRNVERGLNNA